MRRVGMGGRQNLIGVDQMTPFGRVQQLGAEVGMGDGDQRHGSLAHRLAVQVGHAVFGHHVMDVAARRHDAGPQLNEGHDAAANPVLGLGRAGQAPVPACRRGPWPHRA